eukprot:gene34101-43745_t
MQGVGKYWYANGDYYDGDFFQNLPHGQGTLICVDVDKDAQGVNGAPVVSSVNRPAKEAITVLPSPHTAASNHASPVVIEVVQKGTIPTRLSPLDSTHPTPPKIKSKYSGAFDRGMMHGQGVYHYHNGDRYEGEHQHDVIEGRGTYYYANGDVYAGHFHRELKHGQGKYTYANGDIYEGDYVHGLRQGQGKFVYQSLAMEYVGQFHVDQPHGQGVMRYMSDKDGRERYEGEYQYGQRHGRGMYYYASGAKYEGEWKDGKQHGPGVYSYVNGSVYE